MRVLFIANCESLYGANRSMLELAGELKKLGQEIFFFFPRGSVSKERYLLKKDLNDLGVDYAFLDYALSVHQGRKKKREDILLRSAINRKCLIKMEQYAEKWQIDIIHTNSLTHLIGWMLSRQIRKPHVWHIRETLRRDYDLFYDSKLQYRYALWNSEQVICISDYVRNMCRTMLNRSRVITLKDGFDLDKYMLHKVFQKKKDMYHLMICGYIQEGKGQMDAVKAMDYLVHGYGLKNIYLRIVGDGSGAYYEEIKKYLMENHLQNYIEILPFQNDLRELRENTDIALMCSRSEALGRVTIESMLSENLVIGADAAGTKEIIRDGVTGYLYESGNAKALSKKIHDTIRNWDRQAGIIRNAKKYAIQKYDINPYAKKILSIYENYVT